jgi:glycine dehydrogenase subunit 1
MRFAPHTPEEVSAMLEVIGVEQVADLFEEIPEAFRFPQLAIQPGMSQLELERHMAGLADANLDASSLRCFLGAGAYRHYQPPVVDHLIQRGEFLTAYTPYQPEVSQGTLTAVFEFQSMIASLYGLDAANASLYDGASALAEAVLMAARATRRDGIVLARSLPPAARAVTRTYTQGLDLPIAEIGWTTDGRLDLDALRAAVSQETACVAVGYPNFLGIVESLAEAAEIAHQAGALLVAYSNPMALGMLEAPGTLGADIAVGEGQPLGLPLMFGGPYLGLLATRTELVRTMPGRVVGQTTDTEGRRAFVMTLRAREQDIRREKATSNICTNQNLIALAATIYLAAMGEQGLQEVARQCYHKAQHTLARLREIPGAQVVFADGPHFHEFALRLARPVADVNDALLADGILGGYDLGRDYPELAGCMLLCATELTQVADIDALEESMAAALGSAVPPHATNGSAAELSGQPGAGNPR